MDESFDKAFNPLEALAKRAAASNDEAGRKLTFFDKCAAFACLYGGTKPAIVAKAFGLSSATVSYIGGCRPIDDRKPVTLALDVRREARDENGHILVEPRQSLKDKAVPLMVTETLYETITPTNLNTRRSSDRRPRYQDVAHEFDRLGEEQFLRTYYTADIDERIERIERERQKPGDIRTPFSVNPKSDSHKGVHKFGPNYFGIEECIIITFIPNWGWSFDECTPEGKKTKEHWNWHGDTDDKPFRTSKAAYEYYLRFTNRMP